MRRYYIISYAIQLYKALVVAFDDVFVLCLGLEFKFQNPLILLTLTSCP